MPSSKTSSAALTIRVPRALDRRLTAVARRSRQSRSEAAWAILEAALRDQDDDPAAEARRQSLLASHQDADHDTLAFIGAVAAGSGTGWSAPRRSWSTKSSPSHEAPSRALSDVPVARNLLRSHSRWRTGLMYRSEYR